MKKRQFIIKIGLVILFLFVIQIFHFNTYAIDKGKGQPILRLGVNNWDLWRSTKDGQFKGADIDIWTEVAKRNNFKIEYLSVATKNINHLNEAMDNDLIDVFGSMRPTPEREKYMDFISPPYRTKLNFLTYVRSDANIEISKLEDMRNLEVALIGGNYANIEKDSLIEKSVISWNPPKAFNLLLNGSVDIVHINEWSAKWYLGSGKHSSGVKLSPYAYSEYHPCYLVISKKSSFYKEWKKVFGETIQEMIDDGTMKSIIDSYIPEWYEYYTQDSTNKF